VWARCDVITVSRGEADVRNQAAVERWEGQPDLAFLAAEGRQHSRQQPQLG
jgi:hypothetical protein